MNWKSWLGPGLKILLAITGWIAAWGQRRRGRTEQRNAQLEQDQRDADAAARAGRAVEHDDDSVRNDPLNRDNQGDQGRAV